MALTCGLIRVLSAGSLAASRWLLVCFLAVPCCWATWACCYIVFMRVRVGERLAVLLAAWVAAVVFVLLVELRCVSRRRAGCGSPAGSLLESPSDRLSIELVPVEPGKQAAAEKEEEEVEVDTTVCGRLDGECECVGEESDPLDVSSDCGNSERANDGGSGGEEEDRESDEDSGEDSHEIPVLAPLRPLLGSHTVWRDGRNQLLFYTRFHERSRACVGALCAASRRRRLLDV